MSSVSHAAHSTWQLRWRCFSSRLRFFNLFRLTKELSPSEPSTFLLKFHGQCPVRGQQAALILKSLLKIAAVRCVWRANRAAGFSHPEQDAHPFYSPVGAYSTLKKPDPQSPSHLWYYSLHMLLLLLGKWKRPSLSFPWAGSKMMTPWNWCWFWLVWDNNTILLWHTLSPDVKNTDNTWYWASC